MHLRLKPELEKFVNEQVEGGRFASATEVLEAGLARLMLDPEPDILDAQDVREIRTSLEQIKRGETMEWKEFSAEFLKKNLKE